MRTPTKNYTDEKLAELKGKIQASDYSKDVQKVLAKKKIDRTESYIVQVVGGYFYNEDVWDAVVKVLAQRQKRKEAKSRQIEELLEA